MRIRSTSFKKLLTGFLLLVGGVVVVVAVQHKASTPDMTVEHPEEMARLEAEMWRAYYEGRWLRLGVKTLQFAHTQNGFSWWDSARLSYHAARAAKHFRTNTDDERCLPALTRYYRIIETAVDHSFDTQEAARLELLWWQERRVPLPPAHYGNTIAEMSALVSQLPVEAVRPAALLRADAMHYRDQHRKTHLSDAEWDHITDLLTQAYIELRNAINH